EQPDGRSSCRWRNVPDQKRLEQPRQGNEGKPWWRKRLSIRVLRKRRKRWYEGPERGSNAQRPWGRSVRRKGEEAAQAEAGQKNRAALLGRGQACPGELAPRRRNRLSESDRQPSYSRRGRVRDCRCARHCGRASRGRLRRRRKRDICAETS